MTIPRRWLIGLALGLASAALRAEDGYRLWVRYEPIANEPLRGRRK